MTPENLKLVIAATVLVGVAMWLFYWLISAKPSSTCRICGDITPDAKQYCSAECHRQWINNEINAWRNK